MPNPLTEWQRLKEEFKGGIDLSRPDRLASLEEFRQQLIAACGEEPAVLMTLGALVMSMEDLSTVSLADYFGWLLKARHGAIYRFEENGFRCFASFGSVPGWVGEQAILPRWLAEHGLLIRSKLTLTGLTAEESEALLCELDALDAALIAPIMVNEALWGFLTVGPSLAWDYDGSEGLYLSLYGLNIVSCLHRKAKCLPVREETQILKEEKTLQRTMELWVALKPSQHPMRLLLVDEEFEVVEYLTRFFARWGLEVKGTTSEEDALSILKEFRPNLMMTDLSLNHRLPLKLLKAAQALLPEAAVLGTTANRSTPMDALALEMGVRQIFRKPCFFSRLAHGVFETALDCLLGGGSLQASRA